MKTRLLIIIGIVLAVVISGVVYTTNFENVDVDDINLHNQECAKIFDANWGVWTNYVKDQESNSKEQWEPPFIVDVIADFEFFEEFRKSDCRFTVNDWAYLSENESEIWGNNINWPDLIRFPKEIELEPEPEEQVWSGAEGMCAEGYPDCEDYVGSIVEYEIQGEFTWTSEYKKLDSIPTNITGVNAFQICQILEITCPENPTFEAIELVDRNITYFYYELYSTEYLFVIENGQICYSFNGGGLEYEEEFECVIQITDRMINSYYPSVKPNGDGTYETRIGKVIPWIWERELELMNLEYENFDMGNFRNTDSLNSPPWRACSKLIENSGEIFYVSSVIINNAPLSIADVDIGYELPSNCNKWWSVE